MIEIKIKKKVKEENTALNPFYVILLVVILLSRFKKGLTKVQLMICIWAISEPENFNIYLMWNKTDEMVQLPFYYNADLEALLKQCVLNKIVNRTILKSNVKYTIGSNAYEILRTMDGDELTEKLKSVVSKMPTPSSTKISNITYIKFES